MKRPTILTVLHNLAHGGAEIVAASLAEHLESDFDFRFLALDGLGPLESRLNESGIEAHSLDRRPGFDLRLVRRFHRLLRAEPPDLVHAHQCTPWVFALLARGLASRPPIVLTEHGRFHPDWRSERKVLLTRLLTRPGDRIIAVGKGVAEALERYEGVARERIQVIYNGIDPRPFEASDSSPEELRRELGIPEGAFVVSMVARLDPIKDHRTALRAFSRFVQTVPQARLVLVGDGPARPVVESTIGELELEDCVVLLGARSDVPELLRASDVLLLSSVSEGIPLVLIEAMMAGVPIVSTEAGGVSEVVTDRQHALLSPVGDAEGVASALLELHSNPELRSKLAEQARRRADEHFSISAMVEQYRQVFRELLEETSKAPGR